MQKSFAFLTKRQQQMLLDMFNGGDTRLAYAYGVFSTTPEFVHGGEAEYGYMTAYRLVDAGFAAFGYELAGGSDKNPRHCIDSIGLTAEGETMARLLSGGLA